MKPNLGFAQSTQGLTKSDLLHALLLQERDRKEHYFYIRAIKFSISRTPNKVIYMCWPFLEAANEAAEG